MTPIVKQFAFVSMTGILIAGTMAISAQVPVGSPTESRTTSISTGNKNFSTLEKLNPEVSPVVRVRDNRSWNYGPFVNYGMGLGNRSSYKFLWAGFHLSKPLSPVVHAGILSGQFELGGEIMPLWQGYTPAPHSENYPCIGLDGQATTCSLPFGGGTFRGVSLTPVILRWNFLTRSSRFQPWFQGAGGLIYTTHKYPPNVLSTPPVGGVPGINGGTCVWNFTPQGGVGAHYFIRPKRSIDLGVNGVHISSASLGDRNPGVNASIQVQVGYTFWK